MDDLGEEYRSDTPEAPDVPAEGSAQPQPDYPPPSPRRKRKRSAGAKLLEIVAIVLGAVLIALLVQNFIVKPFQIPSESMEPTIEPGDRILVNRLSYRMGEVERGDIIVFKSPQDPEVDFVKRVVAVGGDTIEIDNHMVIVNGEALVEDYISEWLNPNEPLFAQRTVPEGTVFVLGDNRDNSGDSRRWSDPFLSEDDIIGKAVAIYWPLSRIQRI